METVFTGIITCEPFHHWGDGIVQPKPVVFKLPEVVEVLLPQNSYPWLYGPSDLMQRQAAWPGNGSTLLPSLLCYYPKRFGELLMTYCGIPGFQ